MGEFGFIYWWEQDGGDTVDEVMRRVRAEALEAMPREDAEKAADGLFFTAQLGLNAAYISKEYIGGRAIVEFSESQLEAPDALDVCLHEIAHFILHHKEPSILDEQERKNVKLEQEREAWEKVADWLGHSTAWAEDQYRAHNQSAIVE